MYKVSSNTLFTGKQIIYLPSCPSTNRFAADLLAEKKLPEGAVIITDHQTAGRGQRGNSWESEAGANLTFSLILQPRFMLVQRQFYLNMVISLALYELLLSYGLNSLKIKWPNDLYWNDKKIAGILIENTVGKGQYLTTSIVGIGLNINQLDFSNPNAISLAAITARKYQLSEVLDNLLPLIEKYYLKLKQNAHKQLYSSYLQNLYWFGEPHNFKANQLFRGVITGIDSTGRLEVENNGVINRFDSKEIMFIE
ncbi:MAG: biotin--[acetyl-CoA-carboxylase] ligase [Cyclobacteriaceae bacterium]